MMVLLFIVSRALTEKQCFLCGINKGNFLMRIKKPMASFASVTLFLLGAIHKSLSAGTNEDEQLKVKCGTTSDVHESRRWV